MDRMSTMEKGLTSVDKSKESRLQTLSRDLSSSQKQIAEVATGLSSTIERQR
jgi:hypothetical protein